MMATRHGEREGDGEGEGEDDGEGVVVIAEWYPDLWIAATACAKC